MSDDDCPPCPNCGYRDLFCLCIWAGVEAASKSRPVGPTKEGKQ